MRRCPDCGFRAEDSVCPLCGTKMGRITATVQTHTHTQQGERCLLPEQERSAPKREVTRPTARGRSQQQPGAFGVVVAIIILISVLRSCTLL